MKNYSSKVKKFAQNFCTKLIQNLTKFSRTSSKLPKKCPLIFFKKKLFLNLHYRLSVVPQCLPKNRITRIDRRNYPQKITEKKKKMNRT